MVVSHPRCGTHMLRELLDRHTDLRIMPEIFHHVELKYIQVPGWRRNTAAIFDKLFGEASGAIVHDYQWSCGVYKELYETMAQVQGLRIIWNEREDLFAQAISDLMAHRIKRWQRIEGQHKPSKFTPQKFELPELLKFTRRNRRLRRKAREVLKNVPSLEMKYEWLLEDRESQMRRVFEWLGLEYQETDTKQKKTTNQPLEEYVVDCERLRRRFWEEIGK